MFKNIILTNVIRYIIMLILTYYFIEEKNNSEILLYE